MGRELDVTAYAKIPFVEKGRSLGGCDCWGIVFLIYRDILNIELPTYTEKYQNTADAKVLAKAIDEEKCDWITEVRPSVGNVILFRLKAHPMHVGVYIGAGKFIHCLSGSGTVIEKVKSITWRNRIVGFYSYKG